MMPYNRRMTILVVGDANADLTATLTRFPAEGDDAPAAALGWGSGGSAANVAAGIALLGAPARLLARVGEDPAAAVALRACRAAGVDLGAVQVDAALATGLCFAAISPGGERTFFSYRGANVALEDAADPLAGAAWLHIAGHALVEGRQRQTALALVERAAARGIPVSLDLCLPLVRARGAEVLALLPHLAALFGNERELALLMGEAPGSPDALGRLAQSGRAIAVMKCGADGCVVARGGELLALPAFRVAAIDTNGCGDAFVAGFLVAHLRGEPPAACARIANACGALAASRPGAAEALPDRASLDALLAEGI